MRGEYIRYPIQDAKFRKEEMDVEKELLKCTELREKYKKEKNKSTKQQYREEYLELRNKIVEYHMPLLLKMVRGYQYATKIDINDLIDTGALYIIKAVDAYEPNKEATFFTYVINGILMGFSTEVSTQYGEGSRAYGKCIKRYRQIAISLYGNTPAIYDEKVINEVLDIMMQDENYNKYNEDEIRSRILTTTVVDKEEAEYVEEESNTESLEIIAFMQEYKDRIFEGLKPREKEVLEYLYGLKDGKEYLLREVAEIYGVTHQAIDLNRKNAIQKIRRKFNGYNGYNIGD